ncbi:hypothetical protein [Leisingera methylohalidivorans]|uniref:DUF4145 domain-containing protein n=1 Tax=Leisingera methylohalidivorans DSM 14336 TaxID=999552 RepID=V9W273_9RHOB|nr:hypothetical protein [Leisingera methylohalidivorans]AHD03272.1 hypothetical protein METH_18010 [Leisingera methylohalidivorans DSM 14336]
MDQFVVSNIGIFSQIAEDAFADMEQAEGKARTPRLGGVGDIVKFDPQRKSFKAALVYITFSAMWLEARLHVEIAERFSKSKAREFDKKKYECRLKFLGVLDESLLSRVHQFRLLRNDLVHEKAHCNQNTVHVAQKEARKARALMQDISRRLADQSVIT